MKQRRSIRLAGYNYSQPGAYFLTICIQKKLPRLGRVVGGTVELSDAGNMIRQSWMALMSKFERIQIDCFVIMPNHIHGILRIVVGAPLVGVQRDQVIDGWRGQPQGIAPTKIDRRIMLLSLAIGSFKSNSTNGYIHGVKKYGWEPFEKRFWQRNYYERVIRSDDDLNQIRQYIFDNPLKWKEDHLYV